jgi:polysaccharide export outer membrane protein
MEKNMKHRVFLWEMIALVMVLIFPPFLYAQMDKELAAQEIKGEIPADSDQYVIGAEDLLFIHVWKEEALSGKLSVRTDVKISMPLIDEIQAAGQTPLQLREKITERLKTYIENPVVSVIVMEVNSFKVYVSGQVRSPGVYRLRSETSIVQIISLAGGFTDWANPKKIVLIRKEDGKDVRMIINYKKIVQGEDLTSNINLKPGDTIIVP